jgi:hypothetical protein
VGDFVSYSEILGNGTDTDASCMDWSSGFSRVGFSGGRRDVEGEVAVLDGRVRLITGYEEHHLC